jgi:signal transduction histidine kinase
VKDASPRSERTLLLAPRGRDAVVAKGILRDAAIHSEICLDLDELVQEIARGADVAILTEEVLRGPDAKALVDWVSSQPPWSDFPFVLLTTHGGGLERNPAAAQLTAKLGNVTFLERPFHPTTLVSVAQTGLRGRRRQYECRRLNEELESRVEERTQELGAANRQLLGQIAERERVESTLRQMQRLEAVGQLTSGVAHDFNNLLTVVLGNIGFLEKEFAAKGINGTSSQRLGYMRAAAERGAKLTDQLLSFSRRQRLEPRSLDLNETVLGMRDLLQSTMGGSIHIETKHHCGLWPALVDPTQLELAVLNLAINARDAMPDGGTLTISTANTALGPHSASADLPPGDYVIVAVTDTGTGMSDEVMAKVFEPFFTTKPPGSGSGLGLSQVFGTARQSGGEVHIASEVGHGTAVTVDLPRASVQPAPIAGEPRESNLVGSAATILLVDDDDGVRAVTASMLQDLGYHVHDVATGQAALAALAADPGIRIMVTDVVMPGMNGIQLATTARAAHPGLSIVYISGYTDQIGGTLRSGERLLQKPFGAADLYHLIEVELAERRGVLSGA